jgi:hypothetical protein
MKNFQIGMILFLVVIYGCQTSESTDSKEQGREISYIAEIADSVVIQRLSQVEMEAINAETSQLLLHDEQTNEMLVVDSHGEVVSSFNPFVESPDYMGNSSFGWTFYGEDKMVGFGYTHFVQYSLEGKRLKRFPYPIEVNGWVMMDFFPKRVAYYQGGSTEEVLALIPGIPSPRSQSYYDSLDLVYALNFEKDASRPVFRRPTQSVYRTEGKYIDNGYPSMDHLGDGKFALIYPSDKNVYIYDAPSNELINTISLPEAHQPEYKPANFDSKVSPDLTKSVGYVMGMGDKFAVMVNGRIPESEFKKLREIDRWWESPELDQLSNKYGSMDLLLFDQEKYLGEVKWDFDLGDYRFLGDSNGYIWLKRVYDDERDYQTFLKIRIVPEVN